MMPATLEIFRDHDELAAHAAGLIKTTIMDAIRARGRAVIALSGGSTWPKTYALLAQPPMRGQIDWARTFVFVGDERFVPAHDRENNFAMAQRVLLSHVDVPPAQTFPVPTQLASATAAADAYASTIEAVFGERDANAPPRFDLVVLGAGVDGHTAALFPGAASLSVTDRWVVATAPGILPPAVERITMTFPIFNAARAIIFLVTGASKAQILHDVLEVRPPRDVCPATGIAPVDGALYWLVDEAAASRLSAKRR